MAQGDDTKIKQGDQVNANGDTIKHDDGKTDSVKGLLADGKK